MEIYSDFLKYDLGPEIDNLSLTSEKSKVVTLTDHNHNLLLKPYKSNDNSLVDINVTPNSTLELLIVCAEKYDINQMYNINVENNGMVNIVYVVNNQGTNNININIDLNDEGAEANVNVISIAKANVKTFVNVKCSNLAPKTTSNISQRGVALSGGENIFEATGFIGKDCSKAINFQESRVLLLDGASKGDASPILLINHHDVEAGHGASVSRVDEDALYYLMSRGISQLTAERLITIGFVQPLIDKINNQHLKEEIYQQISGEII